MSGHCPALFHGFCFSDKKRSEVKKVEEICCFEHYFCMAIYLIFRQYKRYICRGIQASKSILCSSVPDMKGNEVNTRTQSMSRKDTRQRWICSTSGIDKNNI